MEFYSSGKLLLTSEYVVLSGAKALSLPTQFGQHMVVSLQDEQSIHWKSIDCYGDIWFENEFIYPNFDVIKSVDSAVEFRLIQLLNFIKNNCTINLKSKGYRIETTLEFDRDWGLGSSSSLVANLSKWSKANPINLLHAAFKGSGYDVATGLENESILYQIQAGEPSWQPTTFNPDFKDQLFFVYLGTKQNTEKEIINFDVSQIDSNTINSFNMLTDSFINCNNVNEFSELIEQHESLMSGLLNRPTVKQALFSDYSNVIKSLGAWGGDFVLVVGQNKQHKYFQDKGYQTIMSWQEMILNS
ncbi:MAG: mevalonate kinase [Bacteroidia bacterium]|jgi:mevalonate kinase